MRNAIILHGLPDKEDYDIPDYSPTNSHWFPWLKEKLTEEGIETVTPEVPLAYKAQYLDWFNTIEKFNIDKESVLVGHSCGAGFLLKYLSQNNVEFKHLFLVAPWINPEGGFYNDFFEGVFDNLLDEQILTIFISNDDHESILESVKRIKYKYPNVKTFEFTNMGHFTYGDMKAREFPELLEEILQLG